MPDSTDDFFDALEQIYQELDDAFRRFRPHYIVRTDYSRRMVDIKVNPDYL